MARSYPVVIQENWETYSYSSEGGPVFVSFYAGAGDIARDEFPFCARVILPIKQPNANGGPTGEEAGQARRGGVIPVVRAYARFGRFPGDLEGSCPFSEARAASFGTESAAK